LARIFTDTSALIKLYRTEPDSLAVCGCILPTDDILISQLTPLEFRSAFYGLVRQGLLALAGAQSYIVAFQNDLPQYEVIPVEAKVFQEAERLLDTYAASEGLRPLDALQLASAIAEHSSNPLDTFVTTDQILARVAAAEGFTVKP
jgi:predicted nucleic acid-binding protein